jgi:hypothetical protein
MKFYDCTNKETLSKVAYSNLLKVSQKCKIDYNQLKHNLIRKKDEEGKPFDSWDSGLFLVERRFVL